MPLNINWQHGARSERYSLLAKLCLDDTQYPGIPHSECLCGSSVLLLGLCENLSCVAEDVNSDNSLRPRAAAIRAILVPLRQQVQGCGRHLSEAIRLLVAFGKRVRKADLWLGKHPEWNRNPRHFLGLDQGCGIESFVGM